MFGVLPVDKPAGLTSRDVCNRIDRLVRPDKVGHTGTLDPLATGVLLLAIGSASRLVEFSLGHSKEYEADFLLGQRSATLDIDSQIEQLTTAPLPDLQQLQAQVDQWIGRVKQVPPNFSAINVGGRRAYDLARKGHEFELPAREIEILAIEILAYDYPLLTLRIECGSGTYVRSLGSDIARAVGSDAVMSRLVRTRVGPFRLADCAPLEQLLTAADIQHRLRPPQLLVAEMPTVRLSPEQAARIRNGIPLLLEAERAQRLIASDEQDQLVAVLERSDTAAARYRSLRVFH